MGLNFAFFSCHVSFHRQLRPVYVFILVSFDIFICKSKQLRMFSLLCCLYVTSKYAVVPVARTELMSAVQRETSYHDMNRLDVEVTPLKDRFKFDL